MTVDELEEVFRKAVSREGYWSTPDEPYTSVRRAGIRAVVRALRDEIVPQYWKLTDLSTVSAHDLRRFFNSILGDTGEKVGTHGSPELDEDARKLEAMGQDPGMTLEELLAPATDAAPAECVWTGEEYVTYSTSCESEHEVDPHKAPPTYCPSCGKPIRFTEAK